MREHERLAAAPDVEVLAAVAGGSHDALEVLYRRFETRLFRFLLGVVSGETAQAEDAMAEAFVDVWRQAGTFRGGSSVATWVFAIARHKALSLVRRRRPTVDAEEVLGQLPADTPDPLLALAESEAAEHVRRAIEKLSPEHREVIELSLYHEFPYEQIAKIVGCPVNTVKTRAFHARRHLQRHLAALVATDG